MVINCAAYNLVDKAETEPNEAFAVNTWGVRELARVCQRCACPLVHFSSDYVFGLEQQRSPYSESSPPGPNSVYSMSKLCGEYAVRSECEKHFVIRTCGLYGVWGSGGKGTNFVETMLRLASQGKSLKVVADQTCTPSYTVDVANAAVKLMQTNRYGIYHITNAGSMTWFEFAQAIFEEAEVSAQLSPTTTAEYNAPARRPSYSVLSNDKLASIGIPPPRHWREALAAYLSERKQRST
jgi:dTDP-4-dehydrorhamnose reductase